MNWNQISLANGLRVFYRNYPHALGTAIGVFIGVGSRYEKKEVMGISHFLEHLMLKGTERRTGLMIKQAIEDVGGSLDAYTKPDCTCYWTYLPAEHLERGIDIVSDFVQNPRLSEEDIETERQVILNEIDTVYRSDEDYLLSRLFCNALWPDHALGVTVGMEKPTLRMIKRPHLQHFLRTYHRANNMILCLSGNLPEEKQIADLANQYFDQLNAGEIPAFNEALTTRGVAIKSIFRDTEQTALSVGVEAYPQERPEYYPLCILNGIVGGLSGRNMSSRLWCEIRERRGLCYKIGSEVIGYTDTGLFRAYCTTLTANAAEVLGLIVDQVTSAKDWITQDDVTTAKQRWIGRCRIYSDDYLRSMWNAGEQAITLGGPISPDQEIQKVGAVTLSVVLSVADNLIQKENMKLAWIGPEKNRRALEDLAAGWK